MNTNTPPYDVGQKVPYFLHDKEFRYGKIEDVIRLDDNDHDLDTYRIGKDFVTGWQIRTAQSFQGDKPEGWSTADKVVAWGLMIFGSTLALATLYIQLH